MYWQCRDRSGSDEDGCRRRPGALLWRYVTMTTRTTQSIAHFSSAFLLPGFDLPQPAGDYRVDYDEQSIEAASRLAWRRVGAFIYLPAIAVQCSMQQMVPINPADLEAALAKDHEKS